LKPSLLIILNRLVLGGQSIDTLPLANSLKDEYNITIVYGEKEKDEEEVVEFIQSSDGVSFQKIPSLKRNVNPMNDIATIFALRKIMMKLKPAIVHTHGSKPGVSGRLAAWFARVPVVIHTFHGHLFHSYYNKFVSSSIIILERFLSGLTTKIIVLSHQQHKEICVRYKIAKPEKVKLIPLGVDEAAYNKNAAELRRNFRCSYHLNEDCIAIGIIGRIVPVKNHHLFINVIVNLLHSEVKNRVKFFFVGDGYTRKELEEHLTKEGIAWGNSKANTFAKVIFTSWITHVTDVLHGLDVVALTSFNEGTPLSLIEAQICQKPVVATDVGGVRDTFINNESGFLINDHDVTEFTDKLLLLIQNKELRKEMGEKGYYFVKENFSKQAEVDAFKKLYAECLTSAKKK
jgi:glycosyltransferase involved in cell wall biosynthesis